MAAKKPATRTRDAERSRAEMLDVAGEIFAESGFSGARVDDIATRMSTTKRMIYYYFESKEGLYSAVLERAYRGIREAEQRIDLGDLAPAEAVRRIAELTFDHHHRHPEFVRLVAIENIHHARHLKQLSSLHELGTPAVSLLDRILQEGAASGALRADVTAVEVHMVISGYCVFQVANNDTFAFLFDHDMRTEAAHERHRTMLGDIVVSWLTAGRG